MQMNEEQYNMLNRLVGTHLNSSIRDTGDAQVATNATFLQSLLRA